MTNYVQAETSFEDGRPAELYDISYSGRQYSYTNDIEPLTVQNKTYYPIAIKRGETEDNGSAERANMEIRISRDSELANVFRITPPSEPVTITIRQYHKDYAPALDPAMQTATIWKGRIVNIAWENAEIILTTESVFSSLLRIGVTRKYSRQCTHPLYGKNCRVSRDAYSVTAIAAKHDKLTIHIRTGKDVNWFAGGYIEYRNSETGATERRAISESTEDTITVTSFPLGIKAGVTQITIFAGCDHNYNTCKNKFNNLINFGGQPYIPIANPFGGQSIY